MAGTMMKVLCVMVAFMVLSAPYTEALTCGQVSANLLPCIQYLRNGGPLPPACCNGVRGLNNAARTTPDRKTACGCLKSAYPAFPGIKQDLAAGLPGKCGVKIPYKISPNVDCNKIQ